jgi:uncharacterized zinc-type alcohol dehydrogenase-like protein
MGIVKAFMAPSAGKPLEKFEYTVGSLGPEEIEIKVQYCGICHSDLSMLHNEWQMTTFPFVPGHEVIGEVRAVGERVSHLKAGDLVGLGWFSKSCMHCDTCLSGRHNLCATAEGTMVGRHGGFADSVRCHWAWATPLPAGLPSQSAGPLFCGGVTIFAPIAEFGIMPTHRVGVVGIGGLGHMALMFLNKWGCHVTAFTSSQSKTAEARKFGAHEVVATHDEAALAKLAGSLDFILVTSNVSLNWPLYLSALAPNGRLHVVGAVPEPIAFPVFLLLVGQRSVSSSPTGSPARIREMLRFAAQHKVEPQVEMYPMSKVNDAMEHLHSGKARYRIVLKNDF